MVVAYNSSWPLKGTVIARSGNYEEFGHELSSSGLLGSFGWTRINLQMEAKGGVKQIVLMEEDIPGGKLPRGNAEECTVPQLRRWLLCRGAKTSDKKAELVKRFVCTTVFYYNTCTHDRYPLHLLDSAFQKYLRHLSYYCSYFM